MITNTTKDFIKKLISSNRNGLYNLIGSEGDYNTRINVDNSINELKEVLLK